MAFDFIAVSPFIFRDMSEREMGYFAKEFDVLAERVGQFSARRGRGHFALKPNRDSSSTENGTVFIRAIVVGVDQFMRERSKYQH